MAKSGRLFAKTHKMQRAFMAWLAVFALFAQTLAPLSAAWAADVDVGGAVQVICTASGVKVVPIGQDGQPIEHVDVVSCPFCVLHASAGVLPHQGASVSESIQVVAQAFALPQSDDHASLWRALPRLPRGPPHAA